MSQCDYCGKRVYFAEQRKHDRMVFHGLCFGFWKKVQQNNYYNLILTCKITYFLQEHDKQLATKRHREYVVCCIPTQKQQSTEQSTINAPINSKTQLTTLQSTQLSIQLSKTNSKPQLST